MCFFYLVTKHVGIALVLFQRFEQRDQLYATGCAVYFFEFGILSLYAISAACQIVFLDAAKRKRSKLCLVIMSQVQRLGIV